MKKSIKITLQLIFILVLAGGLFFYFSHQTIEEPSTLPELKTIKFEPAEDLDPIIKKKYAEIFIKVGEAINQNPNDLEAWLTLGSVMKAIKNYQMAEDVWLYIIAKWPDDPIAFGNLGDLYTNFLPDLPKAEEYLKKAVENSSGITECLIYYRNLHELYKYHYDEKTDLADDILLEALEIYPDEPDFLVLLAVYYQDIGDIQKAIEYFEKLLKIDPANQAVQRDLEKLRGY